MLVVRNGIDHCRIEDGLIAQHGILLLLTALTLFGDIGGSTDDDGRTPGTGPTQDGEIDREDELLTIVSFHATYFQRVLFFLLQGQLAEDVTEFLVVLRIHVVLEEIGRQGDDDPVAVVVETADGAFGNVEQPDMHLTGGENKCQTVVGASDILRHTAFVDAVTDVICQEYGNNHRHNNDYAPYPRGDTRLGALGVEPLVLDGLQSSRGIQMGEYTV